METKVSPGCCEQLTGQDSGGGRWRAAALMWEMEGEGAGGEG